MVCITDSNKNHPLGGRSAAFWPLIDSESIGTGEGEAYPVPEIWLLKSIGVFLAGGQHRTDLSALTLEFADSSKS